MQAYILGVDIGTGSTKAVAVSREGAVLFATQHHYPANTSHTSQDPEIIWQAFVQVIHNTLQVLPPPEALSFSSAMHSVMAVNQDGKPLSPLLTWADDRAATIAEDLLQTSEGMAWYQTCGTPIHAMSPLCKIKWWQQKDPDLFAATSYFIGIKDFIWHRLFGVLETDYSLASATGMFHLRQKAWHTPALEWAGISKAKLPHLVDTTFCRSQLLPESAQILGLPIQTRIVIGASDGCLANLGTAALEKGTAAITIGTSGAVRVATEEPRPVFPAQLFNYYLDEGIWITGGAINNGGAAVQWITQLLGRPAITDEWMETISPIPAGANGLLFLPFLLGERAPVWDSHSSAVFIGLQQYHTQPHLLKAVIEGVCYALKSVLEALEQSAGTVHRLHLSGGFTRSDSALQVLADCLGKEVCLLQTEDASAIGAALLGWKAIGGTAGYAQLHAPGILKKFIPDLKAQERYRQLYQLYQPLYKQLKTTMHQLQALG